MTVHIDQIRAYFLDVKEAYPDGNSAGGMYELIGTSFIADEPAIFGTPDPDYIMREIDWYMSQSLNVHDIPGKTPRIWLDVADVDGRVNSNYGHLLFSEANGMQYDAVRHALTQNPDTRQGTAVYTRPSIHTDAFANGRHDFICTNAVNYFIRRGMLHCVVQMRSNDVVFGYRNDWAWQQYVLTMLANDLGVEVGTMVWQAASLHVYPRHKDLIK